MTRLRRSAKGVILSPHQTTNIDSRPPTPSDLIHRHRCIHLSISCLSIFDLTRSILHSIHTFIHCIFLYPDLKNGLLIPDQQNSIFRPAYRQFTSPRPVSRVLHSRMVYSSPVKRSALGSISSILNTTPKTPTRQGRVGKSATPRSNGIRQKIAHLFGANKENTSPRKTVEQHCEWKAVENVEVCRCSC